MALPKIYHKKHFFPLILIQIISFLAVLLLRLDFLSSTLLIFLPTIFYLSIHRKHELLKIILLSFVVAISLGGIIDIIAIAGNAWEIQQTLSVNFLKFAYWEDIIWAFLFMTYILLFYKHFYEQDRKYKLSKNFKIISLILIAINILFYLDYFSTQILLTIKYTYLFIGVAIVSPALVFNWIRNPKIINKILPASVYFLTFGIFYELVGLKLGNWWFPEAGHFIKIISFYSHKIPLEEVIFFMIIFTPALLSSYEFFVEDDK